MSNDLDLISSLQIIQWWDEEGHSSHLNKSPIYLIQSRQVENTESIMWTNFLPLNMFASKVDTGNRINSDSSAAVCTETQPASTRLLAPLKSYRNPTCPSAAQNTLFSAARLCWRWKILYCWGLLPTTTTTLECAIQIKILPIVRTNGWQLSKI